MPAWKKIVSLLGFSMCAAVLGAACTAEVKDPADTTGPAEITEETVATEAAASTVAQPLEGRGHEREHERRRCEMECHYRYERCLHQGGGRERFERERFCRREHEECSERCRVF